MDWASGNAVSQVSHVFFIILLESFESLTLFFQLIYVYVRTTVWSFVPAMSLHFSSFARSIFALSDLSTLSQWLVLPCRWLLLHSILRSIRRFLRGCFLFVRLTHWDFYQLYLKRIPHSVLLLSIGLIVLGSFR